jgi:glutamine phosphoribosylpyrophosphate amidotransferase
MCAIIGGAFPELTKKDIILIKNLFLQSQIRGRHATGISYIDNDILTVKEPVPAEEFIQNLRLEEFLGREFSFVGHCRYSTSHLEYNQPIANRDLSIVHNGVVTQEPFDTWNSLFGYDNFDTKNDSELIFKSHASGSHPLKQFPEASMAVCGLNSNGIFFYRNGKRPIHWSRVGDNLIISSTRDIINRCSDSQVFDCEAGIEYYLTDMEINKRTICPPLKDLQYEMY